VATVVVLLHMPEVSVLADMARQVEGAGLEGVDKHLIARLKEGDLLHPSLGLVVLLVIQVLNVYKPQGLTRYGRRKQDEQRQASQRGKQAGQRQVLQP
jgi:hypothetical protein